MKILIVEPGQYPREAEIDGSLESEQQIVGGLTEAVYPWPKDHAVLVCNDSGLIDGLPLNRAISSDTVIAGTFFICGYGGEDFISLTPEQITRYTEKLKQPELFAKTPMGILVRPCTPQTYKRVMEPSAPPTKKHNDFER